MIWIAAFSALLVGGGEEAPLPPRLQFDEPFLRVVTPQAGPPRFGMTVGAQARGSFPFGAADEGIVIISGNTITILDHLDYSDLFNPGLGFTLEVDLMSRAPPPPPGGLPWSRNPDAGGYVALEWDWFGGGQAEDEAGTTVRPDTLKITSVLVGFKAAGTVEGNFFGDARFGMGATHWPSLDGKFRPQGGPNFRTELFEETWAFAMELRMHFGWKLGPFAFVFGFGGRLIGPPEPGPTVDLDPDILWTFDLELGAEIGF